MLSCENLRALETEGIVVKRSESHPTRDQLAAFVHGQLTDDELRLMETHISECDTCCEELRQVPHDQLVAAGITFRYMGM